MANPFSPYQARSRATLNPHNGVEEECPSTVTAMWSLIQWPVR